MKIKLEVDGKIFEWDREPMPPERFKAVCKLVGVAICGAVLLGAIHMVGVWAIVGAVCAQILYGLYQIFQNP